ncbi:MAG TPA: LptE family protein [Bacteroidota bacterium]|nr:LptE family protein [Bacteroidota bacterium]
MLTMRHIVLYLCVFAVVCVVDSGCYSFTGSSVLPHLHTVAVPLFDDQSGSAEPNLRENLTNKLVDQFNRDNSLKVADKSHADSMIEGVIIAVPDAPKDIAGGETVTLRRITVNCKVTYTDLKLKKKVFTDKPYSEWGDYAASGSLTDRQNAVSAALDKLAQDIVLDTVSGW